MAVALHRNNPRRHNLCLFFGFWLSKLKVSFNHQAQGS
jgi:hypothetical protein